MRDCTLKGFAVFVIVAVLLIGLCNFINQMYHADKKEFWGDEIYSLKNTIKEISYLGLLRKEAVRSEVNAAPLDYIITKVFDDIKQVVGSLGVSDKVYYRLWANFVMVFSGFVVVCFFLQDILRSPLSNSIRMFQLLLLIFVPFIYLYRPLTYHYSAEVRPYALWFALWFISIAICSLSRVNKLILALCLSLMALTMVGSIFQILSVWIAYLVVQWRQNGLKQAVRDSFQIFVLPILLVVFYAFPATYGNRAFEPWAVSWHHFLGWWLHETIIIPMLLVSIVSLYQSKRTRPMMIGPLAVLIVFLMGPLILLFTLSRGYFYTERQYIYYDANRVVFWLCLINFLPFYLEKIKSHKKQILVMVMIFILWLPFVFPKKTIFHFQKAIHNTMVIFGA